MVREAIARRPGEREAMNRWAHKLQLGDVDEFDWVWDRFYDWADANRVWVDTFKVA